MLYGHCFKLSRLANAGHDVRSVFHGSWSHQQSPDGPRQRSAMERPRHVVEHDRSIVSLVGGSFYEQSKSTTFQYGIIVQSSCTLKSTRSERLREEIPSTGISIFFTRVDDSAQT